MESKRIALFGGSFNPPHVGHVEICQYLLDRGDCDEIWIIPCFQHPFGKSLAPFEDRLTMCRFTFQEFMSKVRVLDVEKRLGGMSHTVKTIQHLKIKYPNTKFMLIMGSDISEERSEWKDFDKIKEMVEVIEVPRGPDSPITDISSTEIRRRIQDGEKYVDLVPLPVAVYIITHGLYHK